LVGGNPADEQQRQWLVPAARRAGAVPGVEGGEVHAVRDDHCARRQGGHPIDDGPTQILRHAHNPVHAGQVTLEFVPPIGVGQGAVQVDDERGLGQSTSPLGQRCGHGQALVEQYRVGLPRHRGVYGRPVEAAGEAPPAPNPAGERVAPPLRAGEPLPRAGDGEVHRDQVGVVHGDVAVGAYDHPRRMAGIVSHRTNSAATVISVLPRRENGKGACSTRLSGHGISRFPGSCRFSGGHVQAGTFRRARSGGHVQAGTPVMASR
jgi:hypothetical protein